MKPWDRIDGESEAAYRRFVLYLRLGKGRTLHALWQQVEAERTAKRTFPRSWSMLARKHEWDARAKEWDRRSAEAKRLRAAQREKTRNEKSSEVGSLLVCLGPDPALHIDLAMARRVKSETKMAVHAIKECTSMALEAHLRRERDHLRPVRWLHLACHGGPEGIALADGLVDGAWLSTYLQGVQVLLLAACQGQTVGEWLAVVPHVVTFSDNVGHGDAAVFAKNFWRAIARGDSPDAAVDKALRHSPEHVGEFLVKHW